MNKVKNSYLAALAVLLSPMAANATLIGSTVSVDSPYESCANVVVGYGTECVITDSYQKADDDGISVDISDSSIVFEFYAVDGILLWSMQPDVFDIIVSGLTWMDDYSATILSITSVWEDYSTVYYGGSVEVALTGDNEITLTNNNWDVDGPRGVIGRMTVDITRSYAAVPEPGTLALLGLGLAGLGFAKRKKV